MDLVSAFTRQARACLALGSPMYGALLTRHAAEESQGHPADDAVALRLLGGVHRLVLERRAGALAAYYPSVGGTWEDEAGSAAFLRLLEKQPGPAAEWLDRPPQTNEVGRAAALVGGLQRLGSGPVRLVEIGASAGLNLLADRYDFLDGQGLRIESRVGCDLHPIDATTTEGRLALTAYVWPDQVDRLERLRTALAVAQEHPPEVRRQGAGDFVEGVRLQSGATTVLWHSVMWQYLPEGERSRVADRIARLGEEATDDARFAHLFLEPDGRAFEVVLTTWPGSSRGGVRRLLGTAHPHGLPVTWDVIRPGGHDAEGV